MVIELGFFWGGVFKQTKYRAYFESLSPKGSVCSVGYPSETD